MSNMEYVNVKLVAPSGTHLCPFPRAVPVSQVFHAVNNFFNLGEKFDLFDVNNNCYLLVEDPNAIYTPLDGYELHLCFPIESTLEMQEASIQSYFFIESKVETQATLASSWVCSYCTLSNHEATMVCEACSKSRALVPGQGELFVCPVFSLN